MKFIKEYKYALLSSVSLLLTFVCMYLVYSGGQYFETSYLILVLIPIFDLLGIFFAVRSMKYKESLIGTYLGIIGILVLIVIFYLAFLLFGWSQTNG